MVGRPMFGAGSFETMFIHHPTHYGLANVLEPQAVGRAERRVGFASAAKYASTMCAHDVVVFESGLADLGLPFTEWISYGRSRLHSRCAGASDDECRAALLPAIRNESWRLAPLDAYACLLYTSDAADDM
eukprot:4697257-Prymnesium_polylepis.1